MRVWLLEESYPYEGSDVISVHATRAGAVAAARSRWETLDRGNPIEEGDEHDGPWWRLTDGSLTLVVRDVEMLP